jgi:motility quorum-sensing regulator / GCU-specific mRNA interferase toxin
LEKRKPHYPLAEIYQAVEARRIRVTVSARQGAHSLGLLPDDILDVVLGLRPADFYKSMTTHADHRVWQDVYHTRAADRVLYVKVQKVTDDYWVISFKDRDER